MLYIFLRSDVFNLAYKLQIHMYLLKRYSMEMLSVFEYQQDVNREYDRSDLIWKCKERHTYHKVTISYQQGNKQKYCLTKYKTWNLLSCHSVKSFD